MIAAVFQKQGGAIQSVEISGHSGYADAGEDIVCAAVTSAVRLCECAITDVICAAVEVSVCEQDARVKFFLPNSVAGERRDACQVVLTALKLHLAALQEEYPQCILVSEV